MAIFEKIGNAFATGASVTASKAKEISDNSKLNSELNSKKKLLNEKYALIGKTYVEKYGEEGLDTQINEIRGEACVLIAEIDALEEKIATNKGLKKCESCGQLIDNGSMFCAHCGSKQTVVVNKCVKCRTVLDEGVAFCHNCGTKQPDKNAAVSSMPEAVPAAAPVIEEEATVVEEAVPAVEEAAPAVEEEVPVVEEAAPVVEESVPAVEEEVPVVEEAVPVVEETAPVVEEVVPAVEDDIVPDPVVPEFIPASEPVISKAEPKFIFCTNCGNKEEDGTRFCSECGTKME